MIRPDATILLATIVSAAAAPRDVPGSGPGDGPVLTDASRRPEATASPVELRLLQHIADSTAFHVNSVLIVGDTEAILIDTQFLARDARRVADQIAATGRRLKAIFITHPDHDHFSGAAVIVERFPGTPVYMTEAAVEQFRRTGKADFQTDKERRGDSLADSVVMPLVLPSPTLTVDGAVVEIIPDLQADVMVPLNSVVWIPSLRTLIASDLVFSGVHAWLGASTADTRRGWRAALDRLVELDPTSVIAGHKPRVGTPDGPETLSTMREYLAEFEAALDEAEDAGEVIERVRRTYPWTNEGLLRYSARRAFAERAGRAHR